MNSCALQKQRICFIQLLTIIKKRIRKKAFYPFLNKGILLQEINTIKSSQIKLGTCMSKILKKKLYSTQHRLKWGKAKIFFYKYMYKILNELLVPFLGWGSYKIVVQETKSTLKSQKLQIQRILFSFTHTRSPVNPTHPLQRIRILKISKEVFFANQGFGQVWSTFSKNRKPARKLVLICLSCALLHCSKEHKRNQTLVQ